MIEQFRSNPDALAAAFFFAHDLFRPPGEAQWEFLHDGNTKRIWSLLASLVSLPEDPGLPEEPEIYEREYAEAFESGVFPPEDLEGGEGQPAVPLVESSYGASPRKTILQENILFYSVFALRMSASSEEQPDHLRRQLEFVGYLYKKESEGFDREEEGADEEDLEREQPGPLDPSGHIDRIRVARREFVQRHLSSWLPAAAAKAAGFGVPWTGNFIELARRLAEAAAEESAD